MTLSQQTLPFTTNSIEFKVTSGSSQAMTQLYESMKNRTEQFQSYPLNMTTSYSYSNVPKMSTTSSFGLKRGKRPREVSIRSFCFSFSHLLCHKPFSFSPLLLLSLQTSVEIEEVSSSQEVGEKADRVSPEKGTNEGAYDQSRSPVKTPKKTTKRQKREDEGIDGGSSDFEGHCDENCENPPREPLKPLTRAAAKRNVTSPKPSKKKSLEKPKSSNKKTKTAAKAKGRPKRVSGRETSSSTDQETDENSNVQTFDLVKRKKTSSHNLDYSIKPKKVHLSAFEVEAVSDENSDASSPMLRSRKSKPSTFHLSPLKETVTTSSRPALDIHHFQSTRAGALEEERYVLETWC